MVSEGTDAIWLKHCRNNILPYRNGSLDNYDALYTIINACRWLLADCPNGRRFWKPILQEMQQHAIKQLGWPCWGNEHPCFNDINILTQLAIKEVDIVNDRANYPTVIHASGKTMTTASVVAAVKNGTRVNSVLIACIQPTKDEASLPVVITGATDSTFTVFDVTGVDTIPHSIIAEVKTIQLIANESSAN